MGGPRIGSHPRLSGDIVPEITAVAGPRRPSGGMPFDCSSRSTRRSASVVMDTSLPIPLVGGRVGDIDHHWTMVAVLGPVGVRADGHARDPPGPGLRHEAVVDVEPPRLVPLEVVRPTSFTSVLLVEEVVGRIVATSSSSGSGMVSNGITRAAAVSSDVSRWMMSCTARVRGCALHRPMVCPETA